MVHRDPGETLERMECPETTDLLDHLDPPVTVEHLEVPDPEGSRVCPDLLARTDQLEGTERQGSRVHQVSWVMRGNAEVEGSPEKGGLWALPDHLDSEGWMEDLDLMDHLGKRVQRERQATKDHQVWSVCPGREVYLDLRVPREAGETPDFLGPRARLVKWVREDSRE